MNLSFKKHFVRSIINGNKIHTIREDQYNYWHEDRIIHFCTGLRTKEYNQFFHGVCTSTQKIEIQYNKEREVFIDDRKLYKGELTELARNDGFKSVEAFFDWSDTDLTGKIIHWTDFRYHKYN
jgi:hypothetical protein